MATRRNVIVIEPDPYLALTIESLLSTEQPAPELMAVADVEELYEWARPHGVVVAGPSTSGRAEIEQLQEFRLNYPAVRIVLAWNRRPGASMKEVVAIGADAYVDADDVEDLRAGLQHALTLSDELRSPSAVTAVGEPAVVQHGAVYTLCSPTGGCGKTFFATNLAYTLGKYTNRPVALVDLDLQFGEVQTALRLRVRNTIADAIAISDDDELEKYIPELMTTQGGISVLPAPRDPAEADDVQPQDVGRVIEALREHYDYVIVDTPTGLTEVVLAALEHSDHLFVLAALDLSSIRNLRLFNQTLERLQIPADNISLLLNKEQTGMGIEADEVERLFPRGFLGRIPFSPEVPRSMNAGVPVVQQHPESLVSSMIVQALLPFLPPEAAELARRDVAAAQPQPWWRRMLGRSDQPATGGAA